MYHHTVFTYEGVVARDRPRESTDNDYLSLTPNRQVIRSVERERERDVRTYIVYEQGQIARSTCLPTYQAVAYLAVSNMNSLIGI